MLNPALDIDAIAASLRDSGRILIRDVLKPEIAEQCYDCLREKCHGVLPFATPVSVEATRNSS
jgi:hypothetical protein